MIIYGVTPTGFVRKPFEASQTSFETKWKDGFGQDQDLSEDSPNSVIIGLMTEATDGLWQVAEDAWNSLNRNSAEGVPLENAVALVGIDPKDESPSTANVSFRGDNVTTIPAGTQLKQQNTELVFETLEDFVIQQSDCNWIQMQVNTVSNSTAYRLYIDGDVYSYISDGSATFDEIVLGLKNVVETAAIGLTINNDGSGLMTIEATDKNSSYNISGSSLLDVVKVQTVFGVQCIVTGANEVAAESIDEISTAWAGLDSVINYYEGQAGRNIETEQELRFRTQVDIAVSGFNFTDAIKAKISNKVKGITYCQVYENDTLVVVDGINAKSWEAVIEGGLDTDIVDTLFTMKVAGMQISGSELFETKDSDRVPHNIRFSRPDNLYIWLRVTINSYNPEEDFPTAGAAAIKLESLDYSKIFNIGDVIVAQKFNTPVYEVEGIGSVTIELAATALPDDVPSYSTANINCSIRQNPNFDLSRMVVVL